MANLNTKCGNITRSGSIDQLRASITVVVVAFHAALGYVTFLVSTYQDTSGSIPAAPVVDGDRWAGFDLFFAFNNTFFMALMFFISGLFVVPSLEWKGVTFFSKTGPGAWGHLSYWVSFFFHPLLIIPIQS